MKQEKKLQNRPRRALLRNDWNSVRDVVVSSLSSFFMCPQEASAGITEQHRCGHGANRMATRLDNANLIKIGPNKVKSVKRIYSFSLWLWVSTGVSKTTHRLVEMIS